MAVVSFAVPKPVAFAVPFAPLGPEADWQPATVAVGAAPAAAR